MGEHNYRTNKIYKGNLDVLMNLIVNDYHFGELKVYKKIEIGYEDNNYELQSTKGKFLVKIFGNFRDLAECKRYVEVLESVSAAGVSLPKLYKYNENVLYQKNGANLVVFEFIEGQSFYQMGRDSSNEEAEEILRQASIINQVQLKPEFVYDDWAIINMLEEYEKTKEYLNPNESEKIKPLVEEFKKIELNLLPQSLVHGDMIATNIMRSNAGKIYIVDFACSNYCPRIIELAVLGCNLLRHIHIDKILEIYDKCNPLTETEKKLLPLFVKLAHAMHIISAVRERDIYGNKSKENEYWLKQGLTGLNIYE
ncbi:MAG: phosphotransferase [Candidatus Berkelbacteria bacterium]|nr:phosphotransferase [Candidatus Berkelbacteria bacterium]